MSTITTDHSCEYDLTHGWPLSTAVNAPLETDLPFFGSFKPQCHAFGTNQHPFEVTIVVRGALQPIDMEKFPAVVPQLVQIVNRESLGTITIVVYHMHFIFPLHALSL